MTSPPGPWNIAIIGMACRFPGAGCVAAFWDNLVRGVESITFFASDDLRAAGEDADLLRHPHYVRAAPIIAGHDEFDAAFFGYSPREARLMDPQHRLFLEVAWEAFEDAGYDPLGDKGAVGVYAGAGGLVSSYMVRLCHPDLRGQTGDLGHIGNDRDFLSSRVSFKLNLTGPSINVQSACSTSLVALHLACRALLDGEADLALAGASVVRVPHIRGYLAEPGSIYSPDGHCRAFDARAGGTLFGSGVAAVLLKPLAAAVTDGDHIYAVLAGTAISNDGAQKMSYTASTAAGQSRAVANALAIANVNPESIGYVECHGAATALGDPVEIQALTRAFRAATPAAGFCPIGSVKSNVGHLEQCAGMAGLIKTALALKHGVIPPSLHFETPNPRIPFDRSPFFVNAEARPFSRRDGVRRAGVNSVGMGGTNAFAVLEEAPPERARAPRHRPVFALNVTAQTEDALRTQVARLRETLVASGAPDLRDVCFTTNRGRHHFRHRFSAVGHGKDEMVAELDRFLGGAGGEVTGRAAGRHEPIVFLFSGQGAQYARMGEVLHRVEASFRDTLERCFALFGKAGISVADALFHDGDRRLKHTLYAQPALFSLQIALAELWRRWGVEPAAVIGHSIGEFAAAVVSGVCTLEDAVRLVAARAHLMEALPRRGGMISVGASPDALREAWPDRQDLAVGALNAPDRTVVSGSATALAALSRALRRRGIPFTRLKASHAFHSPLMDPVLAAFGAIAGTAAFGPPRIRWISTLTGAELTGAPDAAYWRDQIRRPVRFQDALRAVARPPAAFVEIGPGSTLVSLGRRCVKAAGIGWVSSLSPDGGDLPTLLNAVRQLYLRGHAIRWADFEPADGRRVSLPTYPFSPQRWWLEPRAPAPPAQAAINAPRFRPVHPLLGERLGGEDVRFESLLDLERLPFLGDHRVFQRVVVPTTAVLEAIISAAASSLGFSRPVITNVLYESAATVSAERPIWLQLAFEPAGSSAAFRLETTAVEEGDGWRLHVTGVVEDDSSFELPPPFPSHARRLDAGAIAPDRFYRFLTSTGLSYGPVFQGVAGLWRQGDEVFARVALPRDVADGDYLLHPAFLDACLHVYPALVEKYGLFDGHGVVEGRTYVPIGMASFHLYRAGDRTGWVHAVALAREGDGEARLKVDIRVYGEDGGAVAWFRGVTIHETADARLSDGVGFEQLLYRVSWREAARPANLVPLGTHWSILADTGGVGGHLAEMLRREGCSVDLITPEMPRRGLASPEDAARVSEPSCFDPLLGRAPEDSAGLVYLWALEAPPADAADGAPSPGSNALVAGACVALLKALDRARARFPIPPRLWLVTRGAQPDGTHAPPLGLAQSPLWGLGRTVALEYPDLWGGLIDLPGDADAAAAAGLVLEELRARGGEDQIALRAGKRLAPRLERLPLENPPPRARLKADATYWIVGGLGAVGLKTAEALVEAGARHLLLSGRRPSEHHAAALDELRRRAAIVVMASDVTSESDVEALVAHVGRHMPPLKGVIHAAAVFEDGVLANLSWAQLQRVLAPKIAGAWLVSRETRELDLDFFVLFSSVLSLWGGLGQAAYTAANSFVDTLAFFRRAAGLPATVINWGPLAVPGLVERWGPVGTALWKQRGTSRLSPEVALDVLVRFLDGAEPQVAVCDTRWEQFLEQFSDAPPLFRELVPAARPASALHANPEAPERRVEVVQWHVSRLLGLDETVPSTQPLSELGLDSLLAVSLANRLRQALKVPVPTALLLKGPSIAALVAALFPDSPAPAAPHGGANARVAGNGWLVLPRPDPAAAMRLFCFPFAGGGAATFRPWIPHLDPRIELVAIEPPGRQTRLDEPPILDLPTFVQRLVPALIPFLDKPFAVYGHCLGALTLFETVRALIRHHGVTPAHVFVSGARPPDEVHRQQHFETALLERLLKIPGYSVFHPVYRQPDEVFAEAILQFNIEATDAFLRDAELRRLILPVTRADFEMSSKYRYSPEAPWDVPITCLTGTRDTYVSRENARSWSRFTSRRFQLYMVDTEHFLVVDDNLFVIKVLNRELVHLE